MQSELNSNSKEVLESEIKQLELELKWKGMPAYVFLSGLAALIWASVSSNIVYGDNIKLLFLSAVLLARFCLVITSENITSSDFNTFIPNTMFLHEREMKNITKFNFILNLLCALILGTSWEMDFFHIIVVIYFFVHTIACLFYMNFNFTQHLLDTHIAKESFKFYEKRSDLWWKIIDLLIMVFYAALISSLLKKLSITLNEAKIGLIFTGIILLCEFYSVGNFYLRRLKIKREELENFLTNHELCPE